MRILILGGTSLTGPFVVRRLHGLGHEVTVFHRGEHETELPAGVLHRHGDLSHPPRDLCGGAPDVVVHMWALTEAHATAFLDCFSGAAGRAVVVSSCDVYRAYGRLQRLESGPPDPVPLSEDAPLRESRYPYRKMDRPPLEGLDQYDKILVERALLAQSALPVTILRFPAVYGPHDMHRLRQWLKPMEKGAAELRMQDDFARWRWTHGFCEDVAQAVVLAATDERARGRIYNVGEPATPTWAERIAAFGRAAGWKGRILPVPAAELPEDRQMAHDFAHHLAIDSRRIRAELGYAEVVSPAEAMARTIAWERG
ncbi:MAG: NAD-dependent epimerase/dehydratase family protein [Acidobacteriia bacterium]|nr:NAD-dependent epimerase/dehydratase family protein [Terriglobia bacterium]